MASAFTVVQVTVAVVFFGGLMVALAWLIVRRRVRRALVLRHPPVPVAEFPDGTVATVVGRVRALGEPLLAPASGQGCVYFQVVLQCRLPRGQRCTLVVEEGG